MVISLITILRTVIVKIIMITELIATKAIEMIMII